MTVSIIIPTLNGADYLPQLRSAFCRQTYLPFEILVIDSSSDDNTAELATSYGWRLHVIPRSDFDHGGTRNLGASMTSGNILVYISQDALPEDPYWLEELVSPVERGEAAASYSRQIPREDASPSERYARLANYPPESTIRTVADVRKQGIRALFFSNVSAATSREAFRAVGGFPERAILNEDVLYAARLLEAGCAIAYQASSRVLHSHDYSLSLQFRRNFDIGVSHSDGPELVRSAGTSKAGLHFVLGQVSDVFRQGSFADLIRAVAELACRFLGYHSGRRHHWMPLGLKRWLSWRRDYWT